MRLAILAAGFCIASFAAQAESIPEPVLSSYRADCTASCQQSQRADYCTEMCGCVASNMQSDWTMAEYDQLVQRYEADPNDATVKATMDGMVAQCRQTVQNGG
ncbi:MAG: hypothetical protein SGJ07_08790 [Rhodospirillaceae bacterium]|nr:hypothetical protein [Rhodospirillaceae bacterium]